MNFAVYRRAIAVVSGLLLPLSASPSQAASREQAAPPNPESPVDDSELDSPTRAADLDANDTDEAESQSIIVDEFDSQRQSFEDHGGRRWIALDSARESGAGQVTEIFDYEPAAGAVAGNAGLGSTSTKLNVASRGVNPRFSSRTSILFDGIPIATAPYGRPQLGLFPLAMFSIAAVAVDLHGAGALNGPHNVGGVVNFIPAPIPRRPTLRTSARADHFGEVGLAVSFASGGDKAGVHVEYAPRLGRGYREHSAVEAHGGLLRVALHPNSVLRIDWLTHIYQEDVDIPGGLPRGAFAADPRSSLRTNDGFTGRRLGTALRLVANARERTTFSVLAYANWTTRESAIAKGLDGTDSGFKWQPRKFRAFGLEPRIAHDLVHTQSANLQVTLGIRGAIESSEFLGRQQLSESAEIVLDRHDSATIGAFAPYLQHELALWNAAVRWKGGYRIEGVFARRRDELGGDSTANDVWALLPSQSLHFRAKQHLDISMGWGRSFGPPQFLQLSLARTTEEFEPERGDSLDISLGLRQIGGLTYNASGWLKYIRHLSDVSLEDFDQPGNSSAMGVEQRLVWDLGGTTAALRGLTLRYADTWTFASIVGGAYDGNQLPWYPRYAMTTGLRYDFHFGLFAQANVRHMGSYLTDYANTEIEDLSGGIGRVPAFTLVDAGLGYSHRFRTRAELGLRLGVRNIGDVRWYTRTDDRNAGILALPGRTFYLDVELATFLQRT